MFYASHYALYASKAARFITRLWPGASLTPLQTVHRKYPKAFIKKKPVLTKTSLLDYVVRIWFAPPPPLSFTLNATCDVRLRKKLDDLPAKSSIASCLDQSFLDMLERPLVPELLVLGSP